MNDKGLDLAFDGKTDVEKCVLAAELISGESDWVNKAAASIVVYWCSGDIRPTYKGTAEIIRRHFERWMNETTVKE